MRLGRLGQQQRHRGVHENPHEREHQHEAAHAHHARRGDGHHVAGASLRRHGERRTALRRTGAVDRCGQPCQILPLPI
jgi:hypothetical protein